MVPMDFHIIIISYQAVDVLLYAHKLQIQESCINSLLSGIIMTDNANPSSYSMDDELNTAHIADPYEDEPEIEEVQQERAEVLKQLAKRFHKSYQTFKEKEFFGLGQVYLISTKWLKRWKKYVSYQEVVNSKLTSKLFGCGKMLKINEDIVQQNQKSVLEYEQSKYQHINYKLKSQLSQGKDFQFLDNDTWQILNFSYANYPIKRFIEKGQDGKIVQIYYQKITIVPVCMESLKDIEQERKTKLAEVYCYFSKYATVQEFVLAIEKILISWVEKEERVNIAPQDNLKLWKMPEGTRKTVLLNTFLQGCKANPSFTYKLYLDGQLIEKDQQIGQLDIVKQTIIVAQLRQFREHWCFFNLKHKLEASCSYCKKQSLLGFVCSCKYAVYCSLECKKVDKTHHKYRCPNDAESDGEAKELQLNQNSRRGLCGLRNLGNTCFMNSGLQCLSHIEPLTEYFLTNEYLKDINKTNPLGTQGQLSTEYAKMIKNLWLGEDSSFSPNHLKKSIGKFQPMFSGYNQHDSGELITYLLDGLHQDLNRVLAKPYTETKDYDGRPDEVIAKQVWQTFLKRNQSIVVDLMYGQFKSVVQCPNMACQTVSITFDPFSVCSLPLTDTSMKKLQLTYMKDYVYSKKYFLTYSMQRDYFLEQKLGQLKQMLGIAVQKQVIVYVSSFSSCDLISFKEYVNDLKKEYSYRTLYVRELNPYQNQATDIKIMVGNVVNNKYYSGETYRKNIAPYQLFFINPSSTNKQVYHQIIGYFSRIINYTIGDEAEFAEKFINVEQKDELFRILLMPASKYYTCNYCGKKSCPGCKLPYDDELFSKHVKFNPESEYDHQRKIDIELYWRKDEKEIEKLFDEIKEETQTTFTATNGGSSKGIPSGQNTVSIYDCLKSFEKEQILGEDNAWFCPQCKEFVLAKKQMKIYKAPKILVLCLKRFKRKEYSSEKIGALVDFPVEGFDLKDYVSNLDLPEDYFKDGMIAERENLLYDLIGISNHFGSTGGGHYTAYCRDPNSGDWYDFDDSSVTRLRAAEDVVSQSAYILFYRRRE